MRVYMGKKKAFPRSPSIVITIFITIVIVLLSTVFLVPHSFDETPELARFTLANNTFFSISPSTGAPYTKDAVYPGGLHLLYSFGSTTTGINVVTLIHLIMPLFMIPLFMCYYIIIAKILFPQEDTRTYCRFIWLIVLVYFLMLPFDTHLALSPYRNIWNGVTFAASCLFPLLFSICFDLVHHFTNIKNTKDAILANKHTLPLSFSIVFLLCLCLAITLCIPYGIVLSGLFILATFILVACTLIIRSYKSSFHNNYNGPSKTSLKEGGNRS